MSKAEDRARDLGYGADPLNRAEYTANDEWEAFIDGYHQAEIDLTDKAKTSSGWDGFFYGQGYRQAEKDLELTWDDVSVINCLLNEVEQEFKKGMHEDKTYKGYCQEVLKRFKVQKEK